MRKSRSGTESPHVAGKLPPSPRDYLRADEVNALITAAGRISRNPLRDQVLMRLMYRHGLRATEARYVKWTDFDLDGDRTFHVRRLKGSNDSRHHLDRDELSALRKLRDQAQGDVYVFVSERGAPLSPDMIARIVARAGAA